jgi:hypothetical protein
MNTNDSYKQQYKIILRALKNDGDSKTYHTTKSKRFYSIVRAENIQKAYLRVSYGKDKTNFGKVEEFYNDGDYETKNELIEAFKAFTEQNQSTDKGSTRNNYRNG